MAHRYHVHHGHHHHRRNPLGLSASNLMFAAWGVAGGVGARAIPAVLLAQKNTGWMGYLLNLAASVGLKFVGDRISPMAGDGMLVGGLVSTGLRVVAENFGAKIPGMGAYWQSYLPNLPASSDPYGRMPAPEQVAAAAAAASAAAARGGMSGGRFTGGRFRRY